MAAAVAAALRRSSAAGASLLRLSAATSRRLCSSPPPSDVPDVSDEQLKALLDGYFTKPSEDALPDIMEAIFRRQINGNHEESDNKLRQYLKERPPLPRASDKDFDDDLSDAAETDDEIPDLYNAAESVKEKLVNDPYFNMDEKKWDAIIKEGVEHGILQDTKVCEGILEAMMHGDKLLPDEIERKVKIMMGKLGAMIDKGEVTVEEAYELYKAFEDKMVVEWQELERQALEAENLPPKEGEIVQKTKKNLFDPPGEGVVLRWESRIVFLPGMDAWHPKNRKVKLAVTLKQLQRELGLSRYALKRLRELVGKRYKSGKDELTLTSERFEHREENRKDCLRTLYALIAEAAKADKLVDEARKGYLKDKLRADPLFMERLKAKTAAARAITQ